MKTKLIVNKIAVKKSTVHGYGVFAEQDIPANDIIEECYTLLVDKENQNNAFANYYFSAADKNGIPLGFGCIYNHSPQPNAAYQYDTERQVMIFTARCLIRRGEEIFTYYGDNWFSSREAQIKELSLFRKYRRFIPKVLERGMIATFIIYVLSAVLQHLLATS